MIIRKRLKENYKKYLIILGIILIIIAILSLVILPRMIDTKNYEIGIYSIKNGDYEKALVYLKKSNAEGSNVLIESIRHHQEAIEYFKARDYYNACQEAGLVSELYPQYKEVKKLYTKALEALTEETFAMAQEHFENEEYIDAYKSLKEVLRYNPNHSQAQQLKQKYKLQSEELEARVDKVGLFLIDKVSIRQREMVNIDEWHDAGYTGKGLTIFHDDTGNTSHSINCAAILQTILPDAEILRGIISGKANGHGVETAYVNCYTTKETKVPFDKFVEKHNISLINNSKTGGNGNSDSKWSIWMNEKIRESNIIGFGAAGNNGEMSNRFYGSFLMVSGVYLKEDDSITIYRTSKDSDFAMFMGYQGGTSYASPFLCGMAGLLKSKHPDMNQEQIYQYFKANSLDLGDEGKDPQFGWGLPILGDPEE